MKNVIDMRKLNIRAAAEGNSPAGVEADLRFRLRFADQRLSWSRGDEVRRKPDAIEDVRNEYQDRSW